LKTTQLTAVLIQFIAVEVFVATVSPVSHFETYFFHICLGNRPSQNGRRAGNLFTIFMPK